MAQKFEEVDTGSKPWTVVCCIQFLSVGRSRVRGIIQVTHDIPLYVGAGARNLRVTAKGPAVDDAPVKHQGTK